ncbi:MAG: geranylgeranylglycerol-phosphate geranylgeranyltransferase [Bacteroidetes bacterium]|nr:geranylgeranylglycerol-phosphate geranylgeranyltransferase [Bacteroidota bacterium]
MTASGQQNNKRPRALKWLALLSIVRWYNIGLTIFAQYLSAFVLMRDEPQTLRDLLLDFKLHGIVLASLFSIAGGFIINNFYDFEKDLINRPHSTLFNRSVSKRSQLNFYILFNIIAIGIGFMSSFKIGVFFLFFTGALWLYSHKLQKLAFIKELVASVLSVACFFAVLLHFSKFYSFIFIYGAFYMSLVYSREVVKQFINFNGDLALDIHSIPVSLGQDKARAFLGFVMVLSFCGGLGILFYEGLSLRNYFILISMITIAFSGYLIQKNRYKQVNTLYKTLLVLGILNILLM